MQSPVRTDKLINFTMTFLVISHSYASVMLSAIIGEHLNYNLIQIPNHQSARLTYITLMRMNEENAYKICAIYCMFYLLKLQNDNNI